MVISKVRSHFYFQWFLLFGELPAIYHRNGRFTYWVQLFLFSVFCSVFRVSFTVVWDLRFSAVSLVFSAGVLGTSCWVSQEGRFTYWVQIV